MSQRVLAFVPLKGWNLTTAMWCHKCCIATCAPFPDTYQSPHVRCFFHKSDVIVNIYNPLRSNKSKLALIAGRTLNVSRWKLLSRTEFTEQRHLDNLINILYMYIYFQYVKLGISAQYRRWKLLTRDFVDYFIALFLTIYF